jgi:hypothetical protein
MVGDQSDVGLEGSSPAPGKEELKRLLIEQFYETSVYRYGSDSKQARLLSSLLTPFDFGTPEKTNS